MAYDKTNDLNDIQADVLTTDTTDNPNISKLKQLKTDTKVPTKAINATYEQLGNAQASAADALQQVTEVKADVAEVQENITALRSMVNVGVGGAITSTTLEQKVDQLLNGQLKDVRSWGSMSSPQKSAVYNGRAAYDDFSYDIRDYLPSSINDVTFTNADNEESVKIYWNENNVPAGDYQFTANYVNGYYSSSTMPTYWLHVYKNVQNWGDYDLTNTPSYNLNENGYIDIPANSNLWDYIPQKVLNVTFTNADDEASADIEWNVTNFSTDMLGETTLYGKIPGDYYQKHKFSVNVNVITTVAEHHVYGMILTQEGGGTGTWVRVNKNFEPVEFTPEHGTWTGMKQVQNATYGEFTEIPVTYVRTETLADGPYAGKNCWWIADGPEPGFHVHPAFIGQDGQPHNLQIASWVASNKNGVPFSEDKGNANSGYWDNISYNTVHSKGWMTGGARPYNIYDHHFLVRMMLTEFGTPNVQAQTVDGVKWTGEYRINYHGIHDPFGTAKKECYCLDGLTTFNGTYQVLAGNGSGTMVETGVNCPAAGVWPVNCRVDQANGINFGDFFVAHARNFSENLGSFADCQYLYSDSAFYVYWNTGSDLGAFDLSAFHHADVYDNVGWRVARCV